MPLDFGYSQNDSGIDTGSEIVNDKNDNVADINTGKIEHEVNGEPVDNIGDANTEETKNNTDVKNETDDANSKEEPLQSGTSIEVGDETYTVDDSGNVLDKNGNIFKEAKDVKAWLDSFEKVDETSDDNVISIDSIREAVGIDITDDNDKVVEFENSPAGIKAYIDAVVDTAKEEHYETAINTLYQKYPILNDVLNYYIANGNSLEGFGEIPDRSNITVDDNNEAQQEIIIRTAWSERGQKGDIDGYIAYLKSSGTLLATAREELRNIQDSDKQYREQLEAEAEKREAERVKRLENYWNGVHEVVKSRTIAGYKIPESIIINRNNQKFSVTPEDFFNYIYRVDKNGKSAYERDLEAETPESRRDDEILRAYLKFVGGNYSNLVEMAINKEKVNKLKLRAKERNSTSIRINRPKNTSAKGANLDLGYN